jgi:hypothetical protein
MSHEYHGVVFRAEASPATTVFHALGGPQSPLGLHLFVIRDGVCGARSTKHNRRFDDTRALIKEFTRALSREVGAAFCLSYESFIGVDDVAIYVDGELHAAVYGLNDNDQEDDEPWRDGDGKPLSQGPLQVLDANGARVASPIVMLPAGRHTGFESDFETAARVLGLTKMPDTAEYLFRDSWALDFPTIA